MKLNIDTSQVNAFNKQLGIAGRVFDKQFLKPALRSALKPVAQLAKQQAPKRKQTGKTSRIMPGRSLASSIRVLVVDGDTPGGVTGLVGVSRKKGSAGWRAAYTIKGASNRQTRKGYNRGSIAPNDFLARAEQSGTPLVISNLSGAAQAVVRKALSKYL